MLRICEEFLRRILLLNISLVDKDDAGCHLSGKTHLVCNNDHGHARFGKLFHSIRNEKEGDVTFLKADVSSADDCRNVVETVMKKYGRIDVLANVAGVVGTRGAFVDLDLADIQNTI